MARFVKCAPFMRTLVIFFAASCASASSSAIPTEPSVRDRLAAPTRFVIDADATAGSIDAQRWTHDGWQAGTAAIALASGELVVRVDASGALTATAFDLDLDPIEIPEAVFGMPAQLTDVRLLLASQPPATAARWSTEDAASATIPVELDLAWSIVIAGTGTPLGTQHLPPLPLEIVLGGDGDSPAVRLELHGAGPLWGWAGLLELTKLDLALSGATTGC